MIRLFGFLVLGFNLWMLIDAYRRDAKSYWPWIIVGVPGGSLAYFVLVKLRARDMQALRRRVLGSLERPPSPVELAKRYARSPSFANRLTLAQGLADAGRYAESRAHFEALLDDRPADPDALYGLGVCELELGESVKAAETLAKLVDLAPTYREYAAWPELIEALRRQGRTEDAAEQARALFKRAPWLPHAVVLARELRRAGESDEARATLEQALEEHEASPRHVQREHRAWAREAKRLLAEWRTVKAA